MKTNAKKLLPLAALCLLSSCSTAGHREYPQTNEHTHTQKDYTMQKVVVDKFIVPEASKPEFLEASRKAQAFIRTLPGFVEGFFYENTDLQSRYNYMTTAVWENEEAIENAKKAVAAEFQKQGLNPQETRKRLKIETERAVYSRSPY